MKFNGILAVDCWWNLPDVIIENIKSVDADEKLIVNTEKQTINEKFSDWKVCNDPKEFLEKLNQYKRANNTVQKWCISGQGWQCGTHNEILGIDRLKNFVPGLLKLYTHPNLLALGTQHLDRTCTNKNIEQDNNNWKLVEQGYYELY